MSHGKEEGYSTQYLNNFIEFHLISIFKINFFKRQHFNYIQIIFTLPTNSSFIYKARY